MIERHRIIRYQDGTIAEILPAPSYLLGVNLAQASDYTAIVGIKRSQVSDEAPASYDVGHIERFQGISYTRIADVVQNRVAALRTASWPQPAVTVVVDGTGVGAAALDILRDLAIDAPLISVWIHGGDQVAGNDHDGYRVPKRDLIAAVAVLLQQQRLQISTRFTLAPVLVNELGTFRLKHSKLGHDQYAAWREDAHDDTVLATALALWYAERKAVNWNDYELDGFGAWLQAAGIG